MSSQARLLSQTERNATTYGKEGPAQPSPCRCSGGDRALLLGAKMRKAGEGREVLTAEGVTARGVPVERGPCPLG